MADEVSITTFADGFSMLFNQLSHQFNKAFVYNREMSLEERINVNLAGKKEKFKPTEESIALFCKTIGDDNPLHHDDVYAQQLGFERKLTPGTLTYANLIQFVEEATGIFNDSFKEHELSFRLIGSVIDFPSPIYPNESIRWQITNYEVKDENIVLYIPGANKKREIVIDPIKAVLSREFPQPVIQDNPEIFTREFSFSIDEKSLEDYKKASGDESSNEFIQWSYPVSLITSALLQISRRQDGVPSGINRGMGFQFYNRPNLGNADISVFLTKEPKYLRRIGNYKYNFGALCRQRETPVTYGEIEVISNKKI